MEQNLIQMLAVYALPVIFAITLHEAAHGYVAKIFGDLTAYREGRITLNPLKHIDLVGTILVPLMTVAASMLMSAAPLLFGWAKPVPVNFSSLNNPKRDMRYVAAAGPAANIFMAFLWAALLKTLLTIGWAEPFFISMAKVGIQTNLVLAVLNMVPILPLDGGRVLFSFLPPKLATVFARSEPYGMMLLIFMLVLNILPTIISPFVGLGLVGLSMIFNL
jgi:Zn-dependent protease